MMTPNQEKASVSRTHVVVESLRAHSGTVTRSPFAMSNDAVRSGASTSPDEMARATPNTTATQALATPIAHGRSSFGTTTGSSRPARRARSRSISERWDSTCSTIVARSRPSSNGSVCRRVNSAIEGCSCEASGWSAPPIRIGSTRVSAANAVAISRTTQSSGSRMRSSPSRSPSHSGPITAIIKSQLSISSCSASGKSSPARSAPSWNAVSTPLTESSERSRSASQPTPYTPSARRYETKTRATSTACQTAESAGATRFGADSRCTRLVACADGAPLDGAPLDAVRW